MYFATEGFRTRGSRGLRTPGPVVIAPGSAVIYINPDGGVFSMDNGNGKLRWSAQDLQVQWETGVVLGEDGSDLYVLKTPSSTWLHRELVVLRRADGSFRWSAKLTGLIRAQN